MLELREVNTYYGKSHVLFNISLQIGQGEIVALLGRNGVGKTTTLRTIMGLTPPVSGSIRYKGVEMADKKPHQIAFAGIGFVPEETLDLSQLDRSPEPDHGDQTGAVWEREQGRMDDRSVL